MTVKLFSQFCPLCTHLREGTTADGNWICVAFPGGIPDEILSGQVDHIRPYPGDHGIQYEPLSVRGSSSALTKDEKAKAR